MENPRSNRFAGFPFSALFNIISAKIRRRLAVCPPCFCDLQSVTI